MSALVRMDHTGHTTLARWTADDPVALEHAVAALNEELERGYFAVVARPDGTAEQVRELPPGADLVVLRQPIAGG